MSLQIRPRSITSLVFLLAMLATRAAAQARAGAQNGPGGAAYREPVDPTLDPPGPGMVVRQRKISSLQGAFLGPLQDSDYFGTSVAYLGDLDGDGVGDLAVGAPGDDNPANDEGALWVLLLAPNGTTKASVEINDTQGGFTGILRQGDHFGCSVTTLGDLDGDGVVDLAVGAKDDDDSGFENGAVWIVFLRSNGSAKRSSKISDLAGGFRGHLNNGDFFGAAVAGIGDVDGDGIVDLAVGASGDDDGFGALGYGAVWILFLEQDGTVRAHQKISLLAGGFTGPLGSSDSFGSALANLGDLDGNGVDDLAVGAPRDDSGGTNNGAVWTLFLQPDGTVASQRKISATENRFLGHLDGGLFGGALTALGDIDGNGVGDLAVGEEWAKFASYGPRGAVWILFLHANGSVVNQRRIATGEAGFRGGLGTASHFGAAVAGVGDANGDGVGDLVVGMPGDWGAGRGRGALWLFALDGVATLDLEHRDDVTRASLRNGQELRSPRDVGRALTVASSGANLGPAIFDSSPNGPNYSGPDPDLLVDRGNLLILQDSAAPTQTVAGVFDWPGDDPDGGTITFAFRAVVEALTIDLVDLDDGGQPAEVRLFDFFGGQRVYTVPAGWTRDLLTQGPPGFRRLRLTTLDPQPGFAASATAVETPFFFPDSVVRVEVELGGSGAVYDLRWDPYPDQ